MKRNNGLDILKIVATILIVFHHYQQITGAIFESINFYNGKFYFGYMVELFFVISGYVMFPYIKKIYDGSINFKTFIAKRFLRLFPLVAAGAVGYEVLLYIYTCILHKNWFDINPTLWGMIIDCLMVQAGGSFINPCVNNPTWYISVLIICYICFFTLTRKAKKCKINPYYLYIGMIFVGMAVNSYGFDLPFFNASTCRGYYAFFWGLILRKIMPTIKGYALKHEKIILILEIIIIIGIPIMIERESIWIQSGMNYIITFVYYTVLIIVFDSNKINKLFKGNIIRTLSAISFDVYIWHNPGFIFLYIVFNIFNIDIMKLYSFKAMFIYTIVCFVVGAISYYGFEKPIKNKIDSGMRGDRI